MYHMISRVDRCTPDTVRLTSDVLALKATCNRQQQLVYTLLLEQAFTVYQQPTLCSFTGIGSGHRQLIAVTCIAEHA